MNDFIIPFQSMHLAATISRCRTITIFVFEPFEKCYDFWHESQFTVHDSVQFTCKNYCNFCLKYRENSFEISKKWANELLEIWHNIHIYFGKLLVQNFICLPSTFTDCYLYQVCGNSSFVKCPEMTCFVVDVVSTNEFKFH